MERICYKRACELLLLFPTDSLVEQISECLQLHHELGLTVCSSSQTANQRGALAQADIAIADATQEPEAAAKAFEIAAAILGSHHVSTYTETMHTGLELFVRTRGGLLLLGPMSMTEWGGYFQSAMRGQEKAARLFERSANPNKSRPAVPDAGTALSRHGQPGGVCMDKEISR
jgi:hypothetical protein